jgi:WD40 repeat protein
MCYLQDYCVLGTSNFDPEVKLWGVTDSVNLLGSLVGHLGQVNNIQHLKGTPLLISGDELGVIKSWDVRTQLCT